MKLSISTTRRENWLGFVYLCLSQMILPTLIAIVADLLGYSISLSLLNILYFVINFIVVVGIFHRFLWLSVKKAIAQPWRCIRTALLGLFFYYFCGIFLVGLLIMWIDPNFSNANNQAIASIATEHTRLIAFCTILLVPIVEETLFRGLLFQHFQKKSRVLAYCISCALFAGIHIVDFIGVVDIPTLLLCFIQYLPAGIVLAWAYEEADTIVAPMLIHIIINKIAMSALR